MVVNVQMPICEICEDNPINIWEKDMVTNAWQKGGCNHYEYVCPDCGTTQQMEIPLEDKSNDTPLGLEIWRLMKPYFIKAVKE